MLRPRSAATSLNVYGATSITDNSTAAFQVQSASGSNVLNVNTSGSSVNIDQLAAPGTPTAMLAPGTPTVTSQGTTGSATYSYVVTAVPTSGPATAASAAGTTTSGVGALSSSNYNAISWTAVSGAASYNVYRTVGGSFQGLIDVTSSTSFDDTCSLSSCGGSTNITIPSGGGSLSASTTYYYKVTALDSNGGETAPSAEVSATTTSNNKTITLSWTAVPGAHSYRVYRGTSSGGENVYYTTNTNSYTDSGASSTSGSPPSSTTAYQDILTTGSNAQVTIGAVGASATGQLDVGGQNPVQVGTVSTGSNATDMAVKGDYLYEAYATNGFNIYDIANPASTSIVGTVSSSTGVYSLAIQGHYLYALGAGTLQVYDISNPASPVLDGTTATTGNSTAADMVVQGRYAYISSTSRFDFLVYDISNPASPVLVGKGGNVTTNMGSNVAVKGNYVYLPWSGGLEVMNVATPSAPTAVDNARTGGAIAHWITIAGNYAYVDGNDSNNDYVWIFDISQPAAPVLVGTYSVAGNPQFSQIAVQGRDAYIATRAAAGGSSQGLTVLDVSNPANPQLACFTSTSGQPTYLAVQGRDAYLGILANSVTGIYDLGGEYAQQLQAGGLETDTLQVDSTASISGDTNIQGGLGVGGNTALDGDLGVGGTSYFQGAASFAGGIQGGVNISSLSAPGAPTVTPEGTAGTTSYSYEVAAVSAAGGVTVASSAGTTSTGNATLSSTNYNLITWTPVAGAVSYDIYRTASSGSPSTTGLIGTSSSAIFDDTGLAGSGSAPSSDTSDRLTFNGGADQISSDQFDNLTISTLGSSHGTSMRLEAKSTIALSPNGSTTPSFALGATGVILQGTAMTQAITFDQNYGATGTGTINTDVSDGASAVGLVINNEQTLSNTSAKLLSVQNNGTQVMGIAGNGAATFQNTADSTTAFQVQNAAGTDVLDVDTTNQQVIVQSGGTDASLGTAIIDTANGVDDFPDGGWTGSGWTLNANGAVHTSGSTANLYTTWRPTVGTTYEVSYSYASCNSTNTLAISMGSVTLQKGTDCIGTNTVVFTANSTNYLAFSPATGYTGTVSNVQVYAISQVGAALTVQNSSAVATLQVRSSGSTSNLFIGLDAGQNNTSSGIQNTALGTDALQDNTTGATDTAVGFSALQNNTTGGNNTALGNKALYNNTTGGNNIAIGSGTLSSNVNGSNNVAVGDNALANATASWNVAVGHQALYYNTIGTYNAALGANVIRQNTTGTSNAALGYSALFSNTTGTGNVALGASAGAAGNANTTGSYNTFLGYDTGLTTSTQLQDATAIGAYATVGESNALVLGCINGTNGCTASTQVGIGTASPAATFNVVGNDIFQAGADSSTAFQVQSASGSDLLNVNTSGSSVDINQLAAPGTPTAMIAPGGPAVTPTGTTGSTTYSYVVTAVPASGPQTASSGTGTTTTGASSLNSSNYNALTWGGSSGAASYNVYRTAGGTTQGLIGNTTSSSFDDTGMTAYGTAPASGGSLSASTTYYYEVTALDNNGGETVPSAEVSATTTVANKTVTLSWPAVPGAHGYRVYRGTTSGGENVYYTTSTNSYTDSGGTSTSGSPPSSTTAYQTILTSNNNSQLTIGAVGTAEGQLSVGLNIASIATVTPTGTAGSGVYTYEIIGTTAGGTMLTPYIAGTTATGNATLSGTNYNAISWNAVPNATSYSIYRLTVTGGSPSTTGLIGTTTSTSFNDTGLSASGNVPSASVGSASITNDGAPWLGAVQGHYAYVGSWQFLTIYDVSDPASPVLVSSTSLTSNVANTAPVQVVVSGNYAYVLEPGSASATGYLEVFNVSNPADPVSVASVTGTINFNGQMTISGNYLYIGSGPNNYLYIYDIANPADPTLVSLTGSNTCQGLPAAQGSYLYLPCSGGGQFSSMDVYNIQNPSNPVNESSPYFNPYKAYGNVVAAGRYAYEVTSPGTLDIFDISNPTSPAVLSATTLPGGGFYVHDIVNVTVVGSYVYISSAYGSIMYIYDASNPASPSLVGALPIQDYYAGSPVIVQGRYAYTVDRSSATLRVYDLGGSDIQQLQAGGAEIGSLSVDNSAAVGGDVNVAGGLTAGNAQLNGNLGVAGSSFFQGAANFAGGIQGGLSVSGLSTPSAPVIRPTGGTGSTSYSYEIVAVNAAGGITPTSPAGSTSTGEATLSTSTYNVITWQPVAGAVDYKVYRTASGGSPSTTGLIATTSTTYIDDTGLAGDGTTPVTYDSSGALTVNTLTTAVPSAQAAISTGNANNIGMVIQGVASQSADLLDLENSTGAVLDSFDKSGNLTVGSSSNVLTISSPGAGGTSEHFGALSSTGTYGGTLAVGYDATVTNNNGVALGTYATAAAASVAVGASAKANSGNSVAIGQASIASGGSDTALGYGANVTQGSSIGIGRQATTTAADQLVIGSSVSNIQNAYIGDGATSATPVGFTLNATGGLGTDIQGASLGLAGGQGTGTGAGGNINLQVAAPGSSGSSLNSLATVFSLSGANGAALFKNSVDSTTAFQIQNAADTAQLFTADTTDLTVTVAGTSSKFATLQLTNAHFESTQTNPPTIGTPTSCGTSPTAAVTTGSTDSAGSFTITSGSGSAGSCQVVVTFNQAYGSAPKSIVLTGASAAAAQEEPAVTAITTTTFTVTFSGTGASSTGYTFYYWVVE